MIYDLAGYFIRSFSSIPNNSGIQINEWTWDVSDIESGVYFAHVEVSDNERVERNIIKIAVIH